MEYPEWRDDGRIKLMIIVGTRPEIIRLAAVITKCRRYLDTLLVHTGQNWDYSLNGIFFRDLGLADPDLYLDAVGADLGETMGNIIDRSYKAMAALARRLRAAEGAHVRDGLAHGRGADQQP